MHATRFLQDLRIGLRLLPLVGTVAAILGMGPVNEAWAAGGGVGGGVGGVGGGPAGARF